LLLIRQVRGGAGAETAVLETCCGGAFVALADPQCREIGETVEAGDGKFVRAAGDRQRVAEHDQIEPTDPECPLQRVGAVVRIGETLGQLGIFGDKRTGAVAGHIGAEGADAADLAEVGAFAQEGQGVGEGCGAPGGVGVEAVPLIQQHALGAFEDYCAGGA
jgi:hypothetical protein